MSPSFPSGKNEENLILRRDLKSKVCFEQEIRSSQVTFPNAKVNLTRVDEWDSRRSIRQFSPAIDSGKLLMAKL